jgi:hypothetical protein
LNSTRDTLATRPQPLKRNLTNDTNNAAHGTTMPHNQRRGEAPAYMHIRKTRHRTALRARHWKAHGGHQHERKTALKADMTRRPQAANLD